VILLVKLIDLNIESNIGTWVTDWLRATERRLERDPDLKFQYHNFMKEYEDLGHMELVKSQDGNRHVISHDIIQSSKK